MITGDEDLLAGLDDVDWTNLSHAYGTADDVPGHLRALCSHDERALRQAVNSLFNSLAHQGNRCQASPYVVPFLARIARLGPDPAREHALHLLTGLAVNWDEESEIIDGADISAWRAEAAENAPVRLLPAYEEALATERDEQRRCNLQQVRDWMAAGNPIDARDSSMRSYDAVLAEIPALLGLLRDEELRVRTRAAYLLAWFPELSDTAVPLLRDFAAHEHDSVAKATSLVAVGILGAPDLVEVLADDLKAEDALVRWAAATAIAQTARSGEKVEAPLLERAVAELAAAAAAPAPVPATDYGNGDFHGLTADLLIALPTSAASRDAVAACLPSVDRSLLAFKAKTVLPSLFPDPLSLPRPLFASLHPSQQQFLCALADLYEGWWNTGGDIGAILNAYGLPATQAGLRVYTGLSPAVPESATDL
ncbi:hypothetical protein ABZY45_26565 [Streptomyces sp. NPDC006516]|uniref:HEAT repeat domain-containing protein n=1 Tax=Streptomyces sp. NPDC006516 TaxID=3154309 RepID=UPI0033A346EC